MKHRVSWSYFDNHFAERVAFSGHAIGFHCPVSFIRVAKSAPQPDALMQAPLQLSVCLMRLD
jgi:hypothetical protein